MEGAPTDAPEAVTERQCRRLTVIGVVLWTIAHLFWIFRAEVNWDEFALLARARDSLVQGELLGGGRPGLATLILMPLVDGCRDTLALVQNARLLWTPFSLGILVAFWWVLYELFENRDSRARDALIGVALVALLPVFFKFSVQVRTDQPALALGLLGGVALLGSRREPLYALLAGALLAVGYTSSQKLVYVAALVGLLGIADVFINGRPDWRRDLVRSVLVIVGAVATLFLFRSVVAVFAAPSGGLDVGGQMNVFAHYRRTIGYSHYLRLIPGLVVPLGLCVLVLAAATKSIWSRDQNWKTGLLAVAIVILGLAVGAFHAGAFPYFWLTLGLFPATVIACGMPMLRSCMRGRTRRRLSVFLGTTFLATAVVAAIELSGDGQELQRETQQFVTSNFGSAAPGFHTTRALLCRAEAGFPTYFSQSIYFRFMTGPESRQRQREDEFIESFRDREVAFIVRTFRIDQFPERIRQFWNSHYVPYWGPLLVPGIRVNGSGGQEMTFEVLVPGEYTLHSSDPDGLLEIGGGRLGTGERVSLRKGEYVVRGIRTPQGSMITLDLPSPPGHTTDRYYSRFWF